MVAHLVNGRGLKPDRGAATEAEGSSALQESGKIVFIYRKTPAATAAASRIERSTFHKLSA